MPYTKEQLKAYWQANKAILNQKRREKRRLAKFGLATEEISHQPKMANPETGNFNPVSHGKPENGKPTPIITALLVALRTSIALIVGILKKISCLIIRRSPNKPTCSGLSD